MDTRCTYLFVYGTLLDDGNDYAMLLKNNSSYVASGSFKGRLYNIGPYPGAVYDNRAGASVFGHIIKMQNDDKLLLMLDEYEGYGEKESQPNEFIREIVPVTTAAGGTICCWVYLYNLPAIPYRQIRSGYKK